MQISLLEDLTRLTCDLVAIESSSDRLDKVREALDYVEQYVASIPGVYFFRIDVGGVSNLVATLRNTRTPKCFLNAHLDVVPGHAYQFQPEVRHGRIYGRGTQDMKGSAAVLLRLMRDLAALPDPPDVGFQFVGDEEIGGFQGTGALFEQGWRSEFFIAAEPSDLQICYAHKGAFWAEVIIPGQPAHGSRPWEGVNPIMALRDGLVRLEQLFPIPRAAAWVTTVVPTAINSGDARNRSPAQTTLVLDIRFIPEDSPDEIIASLGQAFPGASINTPDIPGAPLATNPEDTWVKRLASCVTSVTEAPAQLYREHFATDARFYSEAGIPAVILGPVGAGLHSDEEWVDIASLGQTYDILRRLVMQNEESNDS